MNIGFYTGVSGMIAHQRELDIVSHNIANVNTVGYKSTRASFNDLLYTQMNTNDKSHQVGHGSKVGSNDLLFRQSGLDSTGFSLDFAILGENGFFAVDNKGTTEYTRNGAFSIKMEGKKAMLTAADGAFVLDKKGKALALELDDNGMPKMDTIAEKLGVYTFSNPYGMIPTSGSRYLPGNNTGDAVEVSKRKTGKGETEEIKVIQQALEMSTVDLGTEMVNVINAQRAFQLNSKVVQAADQCEEVINNLR